jgi:hypothetical protein
MSKILAKYGVPEPLVNVIVITCAHIEILTKVGKSRATFPSTSGVKQGENLAPVLFPVAIQAAVESMNEKCRFQTAGLIKEVHQQTRPSHERSTSSGFQHVLLCRRCHVSLYMKRRAYRRIGFHCNREFARSGLQFTSEQGTIPRYQSHLSPGSDHDSGPVCN